MKQSIKPGKLINNRYLVDRVLSEGRFSRTYLTEDTHRFHEACVVKEFAPQIQDPVVLKKTTELFQRQAEILYTIYHPQVANFREFFRLSQDSHTSLFLVQDYVEGETYQNLLTMRQRQGKRFTEGEVRFLLQQLLSVVQYLHEQGIVHRDICPKNIIQREFDQLPVLIDFSSVKEVTAIAEKESQAQITRQPTITALVREDLSGLGTTAIVLLTGKEISSPALSSEQIREDLQQWGISAELSHILLKLVADPSEPHFFSVQEVLDCLTVVADKSPESPSAQAQAETTGKNPSVTASPPDSLPPVDPNEPKNDMAVKSSSSKNVLWGCIGKLSVFLVLILSSGILGWFAGKAWLEQVLTPKPVPSSDILTESPSNSSPVSMANNAKMTDRLRTRLQSLGIDPLFFSRLVDQSLTLPITKIPQASPSPFSDQQWQQAANTLLDKLSLLSPEALQELGRYSGTQRNEWVRQVNQLRLSSRSLTNLVNVRFFQDFPELESQNFQGQPLEQVWYAIAFDTVKALQQQKNYELLARNSTQNTQQVTGKLSPGEGKAYVISLPASKPMEIKLEGDPDAVLTIYSPTGQQTLLDNSRTHQWSGVLPETGYYEIIVASKAKAPFDYQLTLSVW
ncbi:MAG: serine/threonine-protein kinase [Snowella sp.]|nr:serine/threonine-protein kinase [Snowella sp.]